jgi:hypothetical protein
VRVTSTKIILGIAVLNSVGICRAQATKPAVEVVFELLENGYRRQLGTQVSDVERVAREKLVLDLNDQLPFLRFTTDPQDIILQVRLGSPSGVGEMHAVNFQISVKGKDSITNKPLSSPTLIWPYRSATAYDSPLGSVAALETEIGLRFQEDDHDQHDQLVSKVLSAIALSHDGMLVQSKPYPVWVIPFTQDDLCMDFPSYFEIEDAYHTDTGDRSDQFRVKANGLYSSTDPASPTTLQHKIEGIPGDPPPLQTQSLEDLKSGAREQNKVTAVHVLGYLRRSPSCSGVVQPPAFKPAGGSQ